VGPNGWRWAGTRMTATSPLSCHRVAGDLGRPREAIPNLCVSARRWRAFEDVLSASRLRRREQRGAAERRTRAGVENRLPILLGP